MSEPSTRHSRRGRFGRTSEFFPPQLRNLSGRHRHSPLPEVIALAGSRPPDRDAQEELIERQGGLIVQISYSFLRGPGGRSHLPDGPTQHVDPEECPGAERCHVQVADLIQQAALAVLEAARYFDPLRGFQFNTYAADCARRRLARFIGSRTEQALLLEEALPNQGLGDCDPDHKKQPTHNNSFENLSKASPPRDTIAAAEQLQALLACLPPLVRSAFRKRHGLEGADASRETSVAGSLGVSAYEQRRWLEEAQALLSLVVNRGS